MFDVDCTPAELLNVTFGIHTENGGNLTLDSIGYGSHSDDLNYSDNAYQFNSNATYRHTGPTSEDVLLGNIEYALYSYVIVGICAFGLLGNVLNLVVLTSKGLQKTMDQDGESLRIVVSLPWPSAICVSALVCITVALFLYLVADPG